MTEEECELIAGAIRRTRDRCGDLDDLIADLAGELQSADAIFNAVRFMVAGGLREDTVQTGASHSRGAAEAQASCNATSRGSAGDEGEFLRSDGSCLLAKGA